MVCPEEANRKPIGLPDGIETVRMVNIVDYDSCPCIGEHVDNTDAIGEFHIFSQDFNNGVLRIRYKLDESGIARAVEDC